MVSRETQVMIVSAVVALAVLFALRTFTSLGTVSRFAVATVAILATQSVLRRIDQ